MWRQVKIRHTVVITILKDSSPGSRRPWESRLNVTSYFFFSTAFTFRHEPEQILCNVLHFVKKVCTLCVVAHSPMMQTQTFIQVCIIVIEQSRRPCWTGFRFPGVQWLAPLPALFLFSWLVIYFSHLHTESQSSSQDPLLLVIVSGVVNQVFLWLSASFTLAGFQCRRRLAKRPGNQQVHRQVCLDEDKAYWPNTVAPRPSKLAVWTVMLWGRLGTAQRASLAQRKTRSVVISLVLLLYFYVFRLIMWLYEWAIVLN